MKMYEKKPLSIYIYKIEKTEFNKKKYIYADIYFCCLFNKV